MGIIGLAAILAVRCVQVQGMSPKQAWDFAVSQMSDSPSFRMKACSRAAFLTLCEAGAVVGIEAGSYGAPLNSKNGRYALNALGILRSTRDQYPYKRELWAKATAPEKLRENQQMDVVIALWNEKLLR